MAATVVAGFPRGALPLVPQGVPMPSRLRELARRHLPPGIRRAAIRLTGDRLSEHDAPQSDDRDAPKPQQKAVPAAGQEQRIIEVLRRGGSLAEAVVAQVRADV